MKGFTGGRVMKIVKLALGLAIACSLLAPGAARAGLPCVGASTIVASASGDCGDFVAGCPMSDDGFITLTIVTRDCYGTELPDIDVTVYPADTLAGGVSLCPFEIPQYGVTDGNGEVEFYFWGLTGCGYIDFYAECSGGVILGPSNRIDVASYDTDGNTEVNLTDFIMFAGAYQQTDPCFDYYCDGKVNLSDFIRFAGHYQHSCEMPAGR
jgi:hypothetical protein